MAFLTQLSLLGFVISIIIAISFSPLSNPGICDFLASHRVLLETSSYYDLPVHAVRQCLCSGNSTLEADDWNLFYHLGGNGPWVPKVNAAFGTYDEDGKPPEGCVVDQVHMV